MEEELYYQCPKCKTCHREVGNWAGLVKSRDVVRCSSCRSDLRWSEHIISKETWEKSSRKEETSTESMVSGIKKDVARVFGLCSDCGRPDPQRQYMRSQDGRLRCQSCVDRLGPLIDQ